MRGEGIERRGGDLNAHGLNPLRSAGDQFPLERVPRFVLPLTSREGLNRPQETLVIAGEPGPLGEDAPPAPPAAWEEDR